MVNQSETKAYQYIWIGLNRFKKKSLPLAPGLFWISNWILSYHTIKVMNCALTHLWTLLLKFCICCPQHLICMFMKIRKSFYVLRHRFSKNPKVIARNPFPVVFWFSLNMCPPALVKQWWERKCGLERASAAHVTTGRKQIDFLSSAILFFFFFLSSSQIRSQLGNYSLSSFIKTMYSLIYRHNWLIAISI